jgi:hypothetical protein
MLAVVWADEALQDLLWRGDLDERRATSKMRMSRRG